MVAFDADALHRLIDEAVAGRVSTGDNPVHRQGAEPVEEESLSPPARPALPWAWTEGGLLHHLMTILPTYLESPTARHHLIGELRGVLGADVAQPTLAELHTRIRDCRRCPALHTPVLPRGNLVHPDVAFVLEAPPATTLEAEFIAEATKVGFAPTAMVVTEATRCHASPYRPPNGEELHACRGYLETELALWQPRLIVVLGLTLANIFLGPGRLAELHGRVFWIGPWAVMASYGLGDRHHSFLLEDLTAAYRFCYPQ